MFSEKITRRRMLSASAFALLSSSLAGISAKNTNIEHKAETTVKRPFRISINTSTIQGYNLPVDKQIELCIETGFQGIELWISDVKAFIKKGGSPESLAKQMEEGGLYLENMIGFSNWIADDPAIRKNGQKRMQQDMELTARLGGKFIAAPVQGIEFIERDKLSEYASRYRQILEIGDNIGVTPILELWGAGALNQLSDTIAISVGAAHPKATMLLDFYHLYRGGNSFESLRLINGSILPVFHMNDYPGQPERTSLNDSDRVFPGDGICPYKEVLPILYESGFRGGLSVELFNKSYWGTMDAKTILKTSYEKTARVIDNALIKTYV